VKEKEADLKNKPASFVRKFPRPRLTGRVVIPGIALLGAALKDIEVQRLIQIKVL
jgi:hypothetical protein